LLAWVVAKPFLQKTLSFLRKARDFQHKKIVQRGAIGVPIRKIPREIALQ
jgi:hypothetical protein